jgi:probable HAF family extracellular repeat protein
MADLEARTMTRFVARVGVLLALLVGVPAVGAAVPQYRYVDLGVLGIPGPPCQPGSAAFAVEAGRVVGASTTDVCGASHAFLYEAGALTDLGTIDSSATAASAAYGLNAAGDIVGQTHVAFTEPPHAFLLPAGGSMIDLGTGYGAGSYSRASDVNGQGQVVGERGRRQSSASRAVLWSNGRLRDLGTLGGHSGPFGIDAAAYAINEAGQVVGASQPPSGPLHAFVWERGAMRDLGTLGGDNEATIAYALNDAGQVVGTSPSARGELRAFRWEDGEMQSLGTLGGSASWAYGIDPRGWVVGLSRIAAATPGNAGHAFLWRRGTMLDLNELVPDLPEGVVLEVARSIAADGTIVGTTCSALCEPGAVGPPHAFMLVRV